MLNCHSESKFRSVGYVIKIPELLLMLAIQTLEGIGKANKTV